MYIIYILYYKSNNRTHAHVTLPTYIYIIIYYLSLVFTVLSTDDCPMKCRRGPLPSVRFRDLCLQRVFIYYNIMPMQYTTATAYI